MADGVAGTVACVVAGGCVVAALVGAAWLLGAAASAGAPALLPLRVVWADGAMGELLVTDRGGGERLLLESGSPYPNDSAFMVPRWSPDGRRLAYWRWHGSKGAILYVSDLLGRRRRADRHWSDGTVERRVAVAVRPRPLTAPLRGSALPDLSVEWPRLLIWSPDGSRLAFIRKDGDITVVRVDDGRRQTYRTARALSRAERRYEDSWAYLANLAFSPDSTRLGFTVAARGAYLLSLRDGSLRRIAPRGALVAEFGWSPDGRKLAYTRGDRRGNGQLRVVELRSGRTARLTNDVPLDSHAHFSNRRPVWSPDGRRVAFLSNREGGDAMDLYVVDADGRHQRRLTHGLNVRGELRWSPDGRRIAFVGWDPFIGFVNVDGGRPTRVLREPAADEASADYDFAWRPGPQARSVPVPLPTRLPTRLPPRRVRVRRDHEPLGSARFVDVRRLRHVRGLLTDLSRDGRQLAMIGYLGRVSLVSQPLVLDLVTGRSTPVGRPAPTEHVSGALLSPDGKQLLLQQRDRVRVRAVADGRELFVGPPGARLLRWLDDGSVAYRSRRGRLTLARPGGRRAGTEVWIPSSDTERIALSPDGRRLVYSDGRCRTWLHDRASGRRRQLPTGLVATPESFAPDGRRFALLDLYAACGGTSTEDVVLYRADGRRLARLFGIREQNAGQIQLSWGAQSRTLYANVEDAGTRPSPPRLHAYDIASRRVTMVAKGVGGRVLAGPGNWSAWLDDAWNPQLGFRLILARLQPR